MNWTKLTLVQYYFHWAQIQHSNCFDRQVLGTSALKVHLFGLALVRCTEENDRHEFSSRDVSWIQSLMEEDWESTDKTLHTGERIKLKNNMH